MHVTTLNNSAQCIVHQYSNFQASWRNKYTTIQVTGEVSSIKYSTFGKADFSYCIFLEVSIKECLACPSQQDEVAEKAWEICRGESAVQSKQHTTSKKGVCYPRIEKG